MIQMHNSKTIYARRPTDAPGSSTSASCDDDDGGILEEVILLVDED